MRHKRAFIVWLAIYTLITILYYLLGEYTSDMPLVFRTLVMTLIAVPIMFKGLIPLFHSLFKNWLIKEN
jgi:antibiotic biosynthesis monooxygenase (ABM) superfamily enzyme